MKMSLRRGFKADANRLSLRLRRSLGLTPESPIDLNLIARRLDLVIAPLSSFADVHPDLCHHLMRIDPGSFSAATLPCGQNRRVLVHNDHHSRERQRSDIAHEIAHLLLGHPFTLPIDTSGCRNIDRDIEDEATWLGATILISNEAAIYIVRAAMDTNAACQAYGVSAPMLKMRINGSGAHIRVRRAYH
jgi:IrrE N-terminal-like domain